MNTRFLPGIVLLIGIAIALTGCPEPTAPPDERVAVEEADVQEFRSEMEDRLNQVETDINELEQRHAQRPEDDDNDLMNGDDVEDLRDDLQDVRQRLQEPTPEDHGEWTSHRDDILNDVYDLERRLDRKLVEAAQTGDEVESTARERMDRMDQRRQQIAERHREYRDTRQQDQQMDRDNDRPQWEQSYEDARQDAEERLAEVPQLTDDDLEDARGDVAGNLTDMRSALEDGEQRMYERRDEQRRDRADRDTRDNDYDNNDNDAR